MAFSHVFTVEIEPSSFFENPKFSAPVDTRGCDLFVFVCSANSLSTIICQDSEGNTGYVGLDSGVAVTSYTKSLIVYKSAPITSANTVFAISGGTYAQAAVIYGFSGVDTVSPLDVSGDGKSTTNAMFLEADEVTPSQNGCLIVTGCSADQLSGLISQSPFDNYTSHLGVGDPIYGVAVHWTYAASFYIQPTAAAITPRWENTLIPSDMAATVAVFKVGDGGGHPIPGGSGDADGWMDMPRFVSPSRATAAVNVAAGAPTIPPVIAPESTFLITEDGDTRITELGDSRITES